MMNIVNIVVELYGFLYKRERIPTKLLSPFRYVVRTVANILLPRILKISTSVSKGKYGNEDEKIIVSLTSFPGRINSVWLVIECMMRQTLLPNKIVLWLSKEQFESVDGLPESLRKRQNDVFEIRLVEKDYRSHKKYLYAFKEFSNDIVVTIDDDIFYPLTMIESLVKAHKSNPDAVICRHGSRITYDENGNILPYASWKESCNYQKKDFFGSGGGTLFIPSKLFKDTTNVDLAILLCPLADDVWLNAMARINKLPIIFITPHLILPIFTETKERLCSINCGENKNDVQIKNVIEYYEKVISVNPFVKRDVG